MISGDYAFLKKSEEEEQQLSNLTVLVMKDRRTTYFGGLPVPQKGIDVHEYSVRQVLKYLD